MISVAVLGAGRIGRIHAETIAGLHGARLASITDPDAEAAGAVADAHGCAVVGMDALGEVDAVAICTPTDTHADLIERFAREGRAIFCEKPIDLSVARARACLAVVREAGAFLMLGFQRRFEPDFAEIRRRIDAGRIGVPEMVSLTSRDPAPPPLSYLARAGGIFKDMVIHDLDVARWMLGAEPIEVSAMASTLTSEEMKGQDFDSAQLMLRTEAGAMCQISVSRRATYGYDQRIEVHGSEGALLAHNHPEARLTEAGPQGYTVPPNKHFFITRYLDAYRAEMAAFVAALKAGAPPPVTGEDGLRALVLAEAAGLSVQEGRSVRVDEVA